MTSPEQSLFPSSFLPPSIPANDLREILICVLNLLLDPEQHSRLPLVQLLHLVELEEAIGKHVLVALVYCFFEIVEQLKFAGRGELGVFGTPFVKGARGGYHVLWHRLVKSWNQGRKGGRGEKMKGEE